MRDLLKVLQREETHSERSTRILVSIADACARMITFIDVLENSDFIKQTAPRIELFEEDICKTLTTSAEQMRLTLADREVSIQCTFPEKSVILLINDYLAESIDYLLSNAIKSSPPKSAITLTLERDKIGWLCDIISEGLKLPEKDQTALHLIFNRSSALPNGDKNNIDPSLFMVAMCMKELKGSLEYFLLSDNKFCFRLRFAQ
ncbi:MAG: hypothetical protein ABIP97_10895 [Chthoniobacterales bacterium]